MERSEKKVEQQWLRVGVEEWDVDRNLKGEESWSRKEDSEMTSVSINQYNKSKSRLRSGFKLLGEL